MTEDHDDFVPALSLDPLEHLHCVGLDGIVEIILLLSPGDFFTPATEMLVPRTHGFLQCHPVSAGRQRVY